MKTLELAKKAVTRIAEVAVTQDQFDKWNSTKKRQWLKDHPTSKFGKKEATKSPDTKTTTKAKDTKVPTSVPKARVTYDAAKEAYEKAKKSYDYWFDNMKSDPTTKSFYNKPSTDLDKLNKLSKKLGATATAMKKAKKDWLAAQRAFAKKSGI